MINDFYEFLKKMRVAMPMSLRNESKVMVFVDGENLARRFKKEIGDNQNIPEHVKYCEKTYVWSQWINVFLVKYNVIRKCFYTSIIGDDIELKNTIDEIRQQDFEYVKVFKRTKTRNSKAVDISLSTDMLSHAHKKNCDAMILVAGDGDYVPLVNAIKYEGIIVIVWFVNSGLSDNLKYASDHFWNIGNILYQNEIEYLQSGIERNFLFSNEKPEIKSQQTG